jgi:hypothetical protein
MGIEVVEVHDVRGESPATVGARLFAKLSQEVNRPALTRTNPINLE